MATAKTKTLLALDDFARYIGLNPVHFNQVALDLDGVTIGCDNVLLQYSWQQADKTGREELAQAIADAEKLIQDQLGYPLAPTWIADERVNFYPKLGLFNYGRADAVKTAYGYVITGGAEAWTPVALGAAVVYTDSDGDGYAETATVSVPTTVLDTEEITLRYPGLPEEWEIRPIQAAIAGGTVTITFRREQAVRSELLEAYDVRGVDGKNDSSFLSTVDVYRHWNDPSKQVNFVWEAGACSCGDVTDNNISCGYHLGTGCMLVRDSRLGLIATGYGTWDATNMNYTYEYPSDCRGADRMRLWYKAGYPSVRGAMASIWGRAVSYLALSMLDRPLCGCAAIKSLSDYWATDLAESRGSPTGSSSYQLGGRTSGILFNPMGTTRAAIYAWKLVYLNRIGEGVSVA